MRDQGGRWRGRLCGLNAARRPGSTATGKSPADTDRANLPLTRVGYITSKKIGNSVKRNRARRLMREAMRHLADSIVEGWDIVLIAQSKAVTTEPKMQDMRDDLKWLLTQARLFKS